jgi:spore coat polysaccharide biosynthesis protein SpsF
MKIAIIIQERNGNSRLRAKVMQTVLGRPLMAYHLERMRAVTGAHEFVVATTWNRTDDSIAALATDMGWTVVRGPEDDVLARYILAANTVGADAVFRSTGDCPIISPEHVDEIIARFLLGDADHVEIDGVPDGMGGEILLTQLLRDIHPLASIEEREHVTLYVRRRPETYRKALVVTGLNRDNDRWCVDVQEDYLVVKALIEATYGQGMTLPRCADFLAVVDAHPEISALNAKVPFGPIDRTMVAANKKLAGIDWSPARGDL